MEEYKDMVHVIQSLLTSAAITIGGIWTYFIFIKNRSNYPIINLSLSSKQFDIKEDKFLIHVSVKLENQGLVLLQSKEAELRLRQAKPLPTDVLDVIKGGYDPVPDDEQEILWPLVTERKWCWDNDSFEIEPKESDTLYADFIIDSSVEIVEFYFHLKNSTKSKKQLGWSITVMNNLSRTGV